MAECGDGGWGGKTRSVPHGFEGVPVRDDPMGVTVPFGQLLRLGAQEIVTEVFGFAGETLELPGVGLAGGEPALLGFRKGRSSRFVTEDREKIIIEPRFLISRPLVSPRIRVSSWPTKDLLMAAVTETPSLNGPRAPDRIVEWSGGYRLLRDPGG